MIASLLTMSCDCRFQWTPPMLAYAGPNCGGVSLSNLEALLGHATRSFSTAKFSHASAIFKSWARCCSFFTLRARARHSAACFLYSPAVAMGIPLPFAGIHRCHDFADEFVPGCGETFMVEP